MLCVQNPTIFSLKQLLNEGSDAIQSNSLVKLLSLAEEYGYREWLAFDPSTVRGLGYYTDTVFEAWDSNSTLRAICGGGRYDKLLHAFSGNANADIPAVGFGLGDAVIIELLKDKDLLPKSLGMRSDVEAVVFAMSPSLIPAAAKAATRLRQNGLKTDLILTHKSPKSGFSHANGIGASKSCLFGGSCLLCCHQKLQRSLS